MDEPFSEDSERMRLNDAHTNSSERSPSRSSVFMNAGAPIPSDRMLTRGLDRALDRRSKADCNVSLD